jgi:chromate transporter
MSNLSKNLSLNPDFILRCLVIGSTVFGGLAMISYLKEEFVSKKSYVLEDDFIKGIALTQLLPGPIMINLVGYVGYRKFGFLSGLIGALALVFPSTILISILAYFYKSINISTINVLFHGLKPFVVAFFISAFLNFYKRYININFGRVLLLLCFIGYMVGINIFLVFLFSFFVSIVCKDFLPKRSLPNDVISDKKLYIPKIEFIIGIVVITILIVSAYLITPNLTYFYFKITQISFLAFGGAQVALPLYQHAFVDSMKIISQENFLDAIVLSQVTPGPILCVTSFIGFFIGSFAAAMFSFLFTFMPSIIFTIVVSPFYDRISHLSWIKGGIFGLLVALTGLLASMSVSYFPMAVKDPLSFLFLLAFLVGLHKKINVVLLILAAIFGSFILFGYFHLY